MNRILIPLIALLLGVALTGQGVLAQSDDGLLTQGDRSMVEPGRQFSDPALAERYESLLRELRCPQCENQSIGDSNAPVSGAMRDRVAALLREGRSDDEIVAYMVDRWGQQVTFRPGVGAHTVWILAVAALAVASLVAVVLGLRRQHAGPGGAGPLTEQEVRELEALRQAQKPSAGHPNAGHPEQNTDTPRNNKGADRT